MYLLELETRVAGIPCRAAYHYTGWDLLDRKGYRAKWLDSKLTNDDIRRIDEQLEEWVYKNGRLC